MTKPIILEFEGKVMIEACGYAVRIPISLDFKAKPLYRRWVQVKIQGEDATLEFQGRVSRKAREDKDRYQYAVRIPKAILFKAINLYRKRCIVRIEELYPEER